MSGWWQLGWWQKRAKPRPGVLEPVPAQPPAVERRQSERYLSQLTAYVRLISLLGNDAWSAKVRDMSATGIGLHIIQPFHSDTYLGVHLRDETAQPGLRLLVKVVHATRPKGGAHWLLGCEIIRELPSVINTAEGEKPHDVITWMADR